MLKLSSLLCDYQILTALATVLTAWKFSNWRKWDIYYPTILFVLVTNFVYNLVSYNYPLWEYESPVLKTTGSDLLNNLIVSPAIIMLFLTYLDKIYYKSKVYWFAYILAWVGLNTAVEWLSYTLGFFSYHNGWSLWWSMLFNCIMMPMIWLHYRKPLWAIILTFVFAVLFVTYFNIPCSSMK